MSKVFVLDTNHQPLNPVHPGEARLLLKQGKAAIWRRFPFTVILKYAVPAPQGHGSRQVTNGDRYGFPKGKPRQGGRVKGFRTGDMVKAVVLTGTKKGTCTGRVLVRASGSFDIVTKTARVAGISSTYCHVVQRSEGYRYALGTRVPEPHIM